MLVVGLILTVIALVVVGFMVFGATNVARVELDLGVVTLNLTPLEIFGLGAAVVLVLTLGLWLTLRGAKRQRAKRKELKELRHIAEAQGGRNAVGAGRQERDPAPRREQPPPTRPAAGAAPRDAERQRPSATPQTRERPSTGDSSGLSEHDRALLDREFQRPTDPQAPPGSPGAPRG